ncbi:Amidohydrolase [Fusarium albosuccineum]|uniref:Amidohydrolase n=1 Tax=Fusarium albosuccineum TaxID=1237068 RepID=A0A8H4P247_9HYPO|nr:Amidohydrolase [Fusarium albosuccineum]
MFSPALSLGLVALIEATCPVHASSILFFSGTIVTYNHDVNDLNVIRNGSLLVDHDRITAIWPAEEAPPVAIPPDTEIIDASGKILTPGFIDTHRHGWQTLFKTMMSNITLVEYFGRFSEFAAAGRLDAEQVYISQLAGLYESLNAGTTTSLDHAHHTWSDDTAWAGLNASIDSGARVFWAYAFHEVANYTISQQLVNFRDIAESAPVRDTPVSIGVAFDSFNPTTADPVSVVEVFGLAKDLDVAVITTHTVGGPYGFENSPLHLHALDMLNTGIPVVFSHATYMTRESAMLLRSTNQHISITPETEIGMGIGHPHSALILDQASLGIDTHAYASTDLVTQARLWLQSTRAKINDQILENWEIPASPPMSVYQAFLLATRNGGLALRRPDLGVLSVGAKADIVVWDGTSLGMLGWVDPVAAVMLHSNSGDAEHVLVDGKFVKRDGKLIVGDLGRVKARFLEAAKRAHDDWREIPLRDPGPVDVQAGDGTGYGQLFL